MATTHALPDTMHEVMARDGDLLPACVLSETWPGAAGSMTLAAFATYGYCRTGTPTRLAHVNQPAAAVTLSGADGAYWLAIHADTHTAVASWTRQPGTHYLWRSSATQPVDPPGGLVFAKCTVAGSAVSAVDVVLHSYPRNRIPYGGATGALAYDQELTFDPSIKRVATPMFLAYDYAGDSRIAFYSTMNSAGGTNRWAFYGAGTAPSHFNGEVTAASLLHWNSHATGIKLRLGDHLTPGYTLDVAGDARLYGHVGIGYGFEPLVGQYHLNCGSANFASLAAGNTYISGTLGVSGTVNVSIGVQPGYWISTPNLYSNALVNTLSLQIRGASGAYALYSPGTGHTHLGGLVGISYAPDPSYWLRVPNIYVDALRATSVNVDGSVAIAGNGTVNGDFYATIGAFGVSKQGGYYLTGYNVYCTTSMTVGTSLLVSGTLNANGNTALNNDLYVANRVGIGVAPFCGQSFDPERCRSRQAGRWPLWGLLEPHHEAQHSADSECPALAAGATRLYVRVGGSPPCGHPARDALWPGGRGSHAAAVAY